MSWFPEHTIESAPPVSRRFMIATQKHLGYLPAATARWAASPHLLEGFGKLSTIFESGTLDPMAREVVVMTIATRNGCHVCVAMHTARLTALGARPDVIAALRSALPLDDERLDAIRVFTLRVLDTAGDVGDDALRAFLASRLHQAERPGGGTRDRHLHDVHPGQPAHRRTRGRPARRVRLTRR